MDLRDGVIAPSSGLSTKISKKRGHKMLWSNFIHIYQPPTQTPEIVEKVTNQCYRKLIKVLQTNISGKLTININASLTEQL